MQDLPPETVERLSRVTKLLKTQRTLPAQLEAVVGIVKRSVPSCDAAGIVLLVDGEPTSVAVTDRLTIEIDLVQYLMTCGRDSTFFEAFRNRYRYAFDPYVVLVSDNLRTLAMAEAQAKKITTYDALTMPGRREFLRSLAMLAAPALLTRRFDVSRAQSTMLTRTIPSSGERVPAKEKKRKE